MVCQEAFYGSDPANPAHKVWFYPEDIELRDGARFAKDTGWPLTSAGVVKMSKTKRNVVDPDEVVAKCGADAVRLFVLFAAPPPGQVDWSEEGLEGASRFLQRVWRIVRERREALVAARPFAGGPLEGAARELRRAVHRTIDRVSRDLGERLQPNTAVAAMMELVNALSVFKAATDVDAAVMREGVDALLSLLSPFAPHVADELFVALGGEGSLLARGWPVVDPEALREDTIELPVQINGKIRGRVYVTPDADEATVLTAARAEANVAAHLEGRMLKKVLYVPGRILTLVV
jgi:leucyl-tRNA synthetase